MAEWGGDSFACGKCFYVKYFSDRGKCAQKFKRGEENMVVDRGPNGEGKYFGNFLGGEKYRIPDQSRG